MNDLAVFDCYLNALEHVCFFRDEQFDQFVLFFKIIELALLLLLSSFFLFLSLSIFFVLLGFLYRIAIYLHQIVFRSFGCLLVRFAVH